MTLNGILQIVAYLVILLLIVKPLGLYMARVYEGKPIVIDRVLRPVERLIYRLCGTSEQDEMDWKTYALALILFSGAGVLFLYFLQRVQGSLPLNPRGFGTITPDSSFNTAVSFVTNTNWQGYGGETSMSYLTQMAGLAVQNFVSAASSMAVLVALIRAITRRSAQTIGNFWVDLTRSTLYILLPMSIVLALVLVSQGTIQSFDDYKTVPLLQSSSYAKPVLDDSGNPVLNTDGTPKTENVTVTEQTLPMGPLASQSAIEHLGTNGGGFFNTNSAHPFDNSSPLTDMLLTLSFTVIPAALCYTFGKMVNDTRQGWAILTAMMILLVVLIFGAYAAESQPNPKLTALGVDAQTTDINPGGNMEGKETRFGIARSALFATTTTVTSDGSVNSMHDSYMPLGGMIPLLGMHLGETVLGGVGSGLYGMLAFAIVTVFVAGLMVGRTPEYMGKKIEAFDMKMVSIAILIMPCIVLLGMAVALLAQAGKGALYDPSFPITTIYNPGIHGFTEVMYAFTSAGNNNGSAFAGIGVNNPFYNIALAIAMLFGRFFFALPMLALAGSLARKKIVPIGPGTLPTHTPLFVAMLIGVVVIVGLLSFIPVLALGPVVEHLILFQ